MTVPRSVLIVPALLVFLPATVAQQPSPSSAASQTIPLNVVVESKAGKPVTNLQQQDFTILDNKSPRPIKGFKIATNADDPVSVILFIDAVNTPFSMVAYARNGLEKFLKSHEGQLANPTSLAVLTDDGPRFDNGFSKDGNVLSDSLEHYEIGLRQITRSSEWGGPERMNLCINAMHQLIVYAQSIPGRKLVLWLSPGWPLVSGPAIQLDAKEEQKIFNEIVSLSTQLRQTNVTLYDLNPLGVSESLLQADSYAAYVKGVTKSNQVQFGNLALQVLAVQSGGLAIEGNSDVAAMIERSVVDAQSWYRIAFDPPPADKPNEYHHIEVKVDQPGVMVRTRDGYYANPVAVQAR